MEVQANMHDDGSTLVITFANFDNELDRKARIEIALLKALGSYNYYSIRNNLHQCLRENSTAADLLKVKKVLEGFCL